jgi:hypothetical protein
VNVSVSARAPIVREKTAVNKAKIEHTENEQMCLSLEVVEFIYSKKFLFYALKNIKLTI